MAKINENYLKLKAGYLFPEIARRVGVFQKGNPKAKLIRLGIGDVVLPLPQAVIRAFHRAVDEMADEKTFRGYGPEQGYPFLVDAIIQNDYQPRKITIEPSEVFVSDGSKCDTGNIQEIFSPDAIVAVTDPVYPVYVDTNVMGGRTGGFDSSGRFGRLVYLPMVAEDHFTPPLPKEPVDLIYLCSPNNPTGSVLQKASLKAWVDYAHKNRAVILFDAAYEAYITDPKIPHSIYEIEGAKEVAIEFRSFSKNAGFTGIRCAYTIVPKALEGYTKDGKKVSLNALWNRRQTTKFNGVSYPVQRAAAACYTDEGKQEIRELVAYYLDNARIIREGLKSLSLEVYGGVNAPYLWLKAPGGVDSWTFFDIILRETHVVGTPGSGFGPSGEGYFRLSAYGFKKKIEEAMERITTRLKTP